VAADLDHISGLEQLLGLNPLVVHVGPVGAAVYHHVPGRSTEDAGVLAGDAGFLDLDVAFGRTADHQRVNTDHVPGSALQADQPSSGGDGSGGRTADERWPGNRHGYLSVKGEA